MSMYKSIGIGTDALEVLLPYPEKDWSKIINRLIIEYGEETAKKIVKEEENDRK